MNLQMDAHAYIISSIVVCLHMNWFVPTCERKVGNSDASESGSAVLVCDGNGYHNTVPDQL